MEDKYSIDDAIKHAEERAENLGDCDCGQRHKQLAVWLEELKLLREVNTYYDKEMGKDYIMRYVDIEKNVVYDSDKMELISSITNIYKSNESEYYVFQKNLFERVRAYHITEYELKELLSKYDVDKYIELFNPVEI